MTDREPSVDTDVRDHEAGAAVVWALALVAVVAAAGLLGGAVAQQAMVRQRVAASADVAALAGAQTFGDPCEAAHRAASANDTELVACAMDGADVIVRVSRPAPALVQRLFSLLGSSPHDVIGVARAGPPATPEGDPARR